MSTTLNDIQKMISAEFDQSGTPISSTTAEYSRRTTLINVAERMWREYLQGKWTVLKTNPTLVTVANQNYVSLPSGYKLGREIFDRGGLILIGSLYYKKVSRQDLDQYQTTETLVWIEGNDASGYKMYIQPTPSSIVSFEFDYYTKNCAVSSSAVEVDVLTAFDDITKVPDPTFLSDYALGRLFTVDDEPTKGAIYSQEALQAKLNLMVIQQANFDGLTVRTNDDDVGYEPIGGYNTI